MDKKINNAAFRLEEIAGKFAQDGLLTPKESDAIFTKVKSVRLKLLKADKIYDRKVKMKG